MLVVGLIVVVVLFLPPVLLCWWIPLTRLVLPHPAFSCLLPGLSNGSTDADHHPSKKPETGVLFIQLGRARGSESAIF